MLDNALAGEFNAEEKIQNIAYAMDSYRQEIIDLT
jgi:hypothetical protein